MRTSLKRHNEDLREIEERLIELRSTVVSELEETEQHVLGLKTTLKAVDRLLHNSQLEEGEGAAYQQH